MMQDAARLVLAIVVPPAAGIVSMRGLRMARERGARAGSALNPGMIFGGAQLAVQVVVIVPLALWVDTGPSATSALISPRSPAQAVLLAAVAVALVALLRVVSRETTRLAIRRMRSTGATNASALPGVRMRRMFAQVGQQRHLAFSLTLGIVGGVFEELAYRGLLQGVVTVQWGLVVGVLVSSAVFALTHASYGPTGALFALLSGLLLGGAVAWVGDLLPAIAAHAAYNGLTLYRAYSLPRAALPTMAARQT